MSNQDYYNNQGPNQGYGGPQYGGGQQYYPPSGPPPGGQGGYYGPPPNQYQGVFPGGLRGPCAKAYAILQEDIRSRGAITRSHRRTLSTYSNNLKRIAVLEEELAWPAWLVPACVAALKTSATAFSSSR
ncbi:hypothetical protein RhiJN_16850 [Ceratobasidium sp. AG-Ba]|nr:hypothetical protein RhiJN_16850 [Ceratobasidium sp. AG-Ba]